MVYSSVMFLVSWPAILLIQVPLLPPVPQGQRLTDRAACTMLRRSRFPLALAGRPGRQQTTTIRKVGASRWLNSLCFPRRESSHVSNSLWSQPLWARRPTDPYRTRKSSTLWLTTLGLRKIGIAAEEYAVPKDGMNMFGVMEIDQGSVSTISQVSDGKRMPPCVKPSAPPTTPTACPEDLTDSISVVQ